MKKIIIGIFISFLFLLLYAIPIFASNKVTAIDIDAVLNPDGSMYITQIWDGSFDEGTENYIPMNAPDYLTISDLKVADENAAYETVPEWDIDWEFEEKANRCGVNYTDTGYEICFGISKYGQNRYSIEYRLDNVIGGYTDMDGVNFRFVNDQMNTGPTDLTLSIRLADGTPITDEFADVWGFGFEGQVGFDHGVIKAYTEAPITAENHVTVLFGFKKGILSPARAVDDSFETVKQAAFDGSDYSYDTDSEGSALSAILTMVGVILFPIAIVVFVIKLKKRNKQKKLEKFCEGFEYFRDIPNEGNTNATYELGRLFEICKDGAILATGMLRLIDLGCLIPVSEEKISFMGKTKEIVNLKLTGGNHSTMGEYDEYLYTVLEGAAGTDGILQANELERFASQHDLLLRNYINKCEDAGRTYLNQKHCLNRWDSPSKLKYLTPNGKKELGELMGFKRYLEDFSLIAERGVKEMPIWKELLSYAMLFGIADKVAQQMKELYPNIAVEIVNYNQSVYTAYSYQYLLYRNMKSAEEQREQEQRSNGSGGMASLGGGGGSMGGGSGGGSR